MAENRLRHATVEIHRTTGEAVGVFSVVNATHTVNSDPDIRVVRMDGTFSAADTANPLSVVFDETYDLTIHVPPEHEDGKGGSLAINTRGVDHFYDIVNYRSAGGADPTETGANANCLVTLRTQSPVQHDHLDGSPIERFGVAVKVNRQSITETVVMYVPERGSKSDRRGTATEERVQFGRTVYPVAIDAAWECGSPGGERIFFSGADGMVYEDRVGTNFDGGDIVGFVRTPFVHAGRPSHIKRWRRIDLELGSSSSLQFKVLMDLDFANSAEGSLLRNDEEVTGQGGYWDSGDVWDSFDWDGVSVAQASTDLVGEGINASFLLSFRSDSAEGLVLQGMLLHYSTRRLRR